MSSASQTRSWTLLAPALVMGLLVTGATLSGNIDETPPPVQTVAVYECRRAVGPIEIDGRADEEAWRNAVVIDQFVLFWLREDARPAKTATKARLLWDDDYLYFFAEMEDADLYADITERDGMTWENDVFELFFKPSPEKLGYYEFQVTPANTQLDMFMPSRGSGGYRRWKDAHEFRWQTAVVVRGTLNDPQDRDEGWSAEGRIPWSDFAHTGSRPSAGDEWKFALCRYDYSLDFEAPELSSTAPLKQLNFHRYEDYAVLRFAGR